jgi:hypothetical protein
MPTTTDARQAHISLRTGISERRDSLGAVIIPRPIRPHRDDLYCTSTQTPSLNCPTYGLNRYRATNLRGFAAGARQASSPRPFVRLVWSFCGGNKNASQLDCALRNRETSPGDGANEVRERRAHPILVLLQKFWRNSDNSSSLIVPPTPSNDRRAPRGKAIARRSSRLAGMAARIMLLGVPADFGGQGGKTCSNALELTPSSL